MTAAAPSMEFMDPVAALVDSGRAVLFDRNVMVPIRGGYGEWVERHFPKLFVYYHLETEAYVVAVWVLEVPDGDPHHYPMIELDLVSGNPARDSFCGWFPSYDYLRERVLGQTESVKHAIRTALESEQKKKERLLRHGEKLDSLTKFCKNKGMDETAAKLGSFIPISPDDPKDYGL